MIGVSPEEMETLRLVDELRCRLPYMDAMEVVVLERGLPAMITTARQGASRIQVQALEILAEEVQQVRDGLITRDLAQELSAWFAAARKGQ